MEGEGAQGAASNEGAERVSHDALMSLLVEVANGGGLKASMTLWIGGSIVSGELVGMGDYIEGVARELEKVGDTGSTLADVFRQIGESWLAAVKSDDAPPPRLIHLENARSYSPGGTPIPSDRGVWWRGRLDSVDGWCFGELSEAAS
jgi:hypothetical protein